MFGIVPHMYRDSMGVWDGVRVSEKGGIDFYRLNETDLKKSGSATPSPDSMSQYVRKFPCDRVN